MFFLFLTFNLIIFTTYSSQPLWPLPTSYTNGTTTVSLCTSFKFQYSGNSQILQNGLTRFYQYIASTNNNFILNNFQNNTNKQLTNLCQGSISVTSTDESLNINTDVSYLLQITSTVIQISSQTIYGALYGLTTLEQLIIYDNTINNNIINGLPWIINDKPIFNHRGLMIDTSRNWLSINMIKKIILGMSYVKLNVLHWHIVDATSFPFYSKTHPELSNNGAYLSKYIYYPTNISDIIMYAKQFGIRVIPEFDTPGHEYSITKSHPELMMCNSLNYQTSNTCPEPPCGYLDPNKNGTYMLIEDVINDAIDVFDDEYFHLGGDEVNPSCWGSQTNQLYENWMKYFVNMLNNNKKIPIIWSGDIIMNSNVGQHNIDVYIQTWDSPTYKELALENGYKIIDSNVNYLYLDCGTGSWLYPESNSWCDPYKNWGDIYNYSIIDGIKQEYIKNIIGGEVCIWGESVDDYNIEQKLWPRSAAFAEKLWRNYQWNSKQDVNDVVYRLAIQRDRMLQNGIMSNPVQPLYCTMYPSYCNYYRNGVASKLFDKFID